MILCIGVKTVRETEVYYGQGGIVRMISPITCGMAIALGTWKRMPACGILMSETEVVIPARTMTGVLIIAGPGRPRCAG